MTLVSKRFDELSGAEVYEILKARMAVFYMEQHIFYLDMDDVDYDSLHVYLEEDGKVLAYLRAYEDAGEPGIVHIGRVLTVERGKGFGRRIMEEGIEAVRTAYHPERIRLDAQLPVVEFYEKLGFVPIGEEFLEAGIPHRAMELALIGTA